jgi:hypothetical protein
LSSIDWRQSLHLTSPWKSCWQNKWEK